jgi:DGQHR domain-containing protein
MYNTPALEGHQGEHRYFLTAMKWGQLDQLLVFHDELDDLDEDNRMQRGLARKRIGDLVEYLQEAPDHFFSALTLIVLPRELDREASETVDEEDGGDEPDFYFERAEKKGPAKQIFGTLYLSGDVRLFPADGQHRAYAAREALRLDPSLAKEEVPVVLVPFRDAPQVRQLFSDLNLNAKPVSKTTGYDFETRDPLALIAKRVGLTVALFKSRVNRTSNSLPRSSANVISLNTLVSGTKTILEALAKSAGVTYDEYVDDEDMATVEVAAVWEVIVDAFATYWADVLNDVDGAAGQVREDYVFAHGLGWLALAQAAANIITQHPVDWERRFRKAVKTFNWDRTDPVWTGNAVIHNPATGTYRVNNTAPAVKQLAELVTQAA